MNEPDASQLPADSAPVAPAVAHGGAVSPQAFISYASADSAMANAVCHALERAGVKCWIAPRDVTPGDLYAANIVHAIDTTRVIVLVMSEHAAESSHVLREVERASSKRHPILTFRIDQAPLPDGLAYFLNTAQWLDASATGVNRALPKLVEAVRGVLAKGTLAAPASKGPSMIARVNQRSSRMLLALAVLIVAALMYVGVDRLWLSKRVDAQSALMELPPPLPTDNPGSLTTAKNSIAVLPFVDMSAEKNQEYMSDGIAEELLNLLAQVPDLKVIARTSSFAFKGQNIEVSEIAKRLNVAHVLEGSVRTSGNAVRITAQLVRAADSSHLWSQKYDRPLSDIFVVQDEIANAIVQALQIKLAGGELSRRRGGTQNLQAYRLYLQAAPGIAESTEESLSAADNYLMQAIELDPEFGNAWSKRAVVVGAQLSSGYSNITTQRGYEDYRRYIETALKWSPDNATAHAGLAGLHIFENWDWPAAERELELAMAIDPNNPDVLSSMSFLASTFGNQKEAMRYARLAISRDPKDLVYVEGLGHVYYADGQFEEAERIFRSVIELQPKRPFTHQYLTTVLLAQGKANAALEALRQEPEEISRTAFDPIVLQAVGRQAEADAALEKLSEVWANEWAVAIAQVYAYRGDVDRTMEWLERAFRQKDTDMMRIIDQPLFNRVVSHPRFQAFVRDRLKIKRKLSPVV
jgi:TolB-like protein/Tfp pilus assembly protein PilF